MHEKSLYGNIKSTDSIFAYAINNEEDIFKRHMSDELINASKSYPVVTVMEPRQSGKTTLVQNIFPEKPYANLESLRTRELAETDPIGFLDRYPDGAILDGIRDSNQNFIFIETQADEKLIYCFKREIS